MAGGTSPEQLTELLPVSGLTVIDLTTGTNWDRYAVLARLNELRGRLASSAQGPIVILGRPGWLAEAAARAGDLWSVRSLVRRMRVTGVSPQPDASRVPDIAIRESQTHTALLFTTMPAFSPASEEDARSRRLVNVATRLFPHDIHGARRAIAAALDLTQSDPERAVTLLAAAELAGFDADPVVASEALEELARLIVDGTGDRSWPSGIARALADAIRRVAIRFGTGGVIEPALDALVDAARDLADRIATPEALRDLSVSLDNVGAVAQARGDWDRATTAYDESLTIRRDLADRLATPEALRDLSVSLDNVGAVAQARGDWDRATTAYDESLELARAAKQGDSSMVARAWVDHLEANLRAAEIPVDD